MAAEALDAAGWLTAEGGTACTTIVAEVGEDQDNKNGDGFL